MTGPNPDTIATTPAGARAAASPDAPTAGALLRRGREAAGLSLDAVAQQLKLAPRQVSALESDDFARLPGRTFIRGFVRNYARLVCIDPEAVLAALAATEAPSLDTPALHPTAPTMGELPTHENGKPGWTRWAIPLTLVAIIAAAAIYEFSGSHGDLTRPAEPAKGDAAPAKAAPSAPASAPAPSPASADTPLVNPIAPAPPPGSAPVSGVPADAGAAAPAATTAVPAAPSGPTATGATAAPAAPAADAAAAPAATLVVGTRAKSWAEVKDATGRVLLSQTLAAGQPASVSGTPPFSVVIGNANDATLELRGKAIDLAPHIRQNIARLRLE